MQQYLTGEQVARIVTIPVRGWVNYDSDYIQGEFDFEVQGGSTEPQNETFRRQSAMQLVDASMPFLEVGVADPRALYMKVLDGFGEKDADAVHQPAGRQPAATQQGRSSAEACRPDHRLRLGHRQGHLLALPPGPPPEMGGPPRCPARRCSSSCRLRSSRCCRLRSSTASHRQIPRRWWSRS